MRRGTTPAVELVLDASMAGYDYYVTFECGGVQITKTQDDCSLSLDGKTISVMLTQKDTLSLDAAQPVLVQVRYKDGDLAYATNIAKTTVGAILLEGEI